MKKGNISLKGVKQVIRSSPFSLNGPKSKLDRAVLAIILIATFSMDYFSSVLTGSITWSPTHTLVDGSSLTGIQGGTLDYHPEDPIVREQLVILGTSLAMAAWTTSEPAKVSTEKFPVLKRVISSAQYLPINSIVQNLTLPYFAVDSFEWIKDPNASLTEKQKSFFTGNKTQDNPFYSGTSCAALLPDDNWGYVPTANSSIPTLVSETRIMIYLVTTAREADCRAVNGTGIGTIQPFRASPKTPSFNCIAAAKVTYRAGAAKCKKCRLSAPGVFQSDRSLTPVKDILTAGALTLAPVIGMNMALADQLLFENFSSPQDRAIQTISRSYQAAWMSITNMFMPRTEQTNTSISVFMSLASVVRWRLCLWVALHMCVLFGGLLFVYLHSRYHHPWVADPVSAAFMLNNGDMMDARIWGGVDPWVADEDDLPKGFLELKEDEGRGRYLAWKKEI